jgi:hypothetical protein
MVKMLLHTSPSAVGGIRWSQSIKSLLHFFEKCCNQEAFGCTQLKRYCRGWTGADKTISKRKKEEIQKTQDIMV